MKRLTLAAFLFASSCFAQMPMGGITGGGSAPTIALSGAARSNTSSVTLATINAGDAKAVVLTWKDPTNNFTGGSDADGAYTCTTATKETANSRTVMICYSFNSTSGSHTFTATFSPGAVNEPTLDFVAFSGIQTSAALDTSGVRPTSGTVSTVSGANNATSSALTTTTKGVIIVGAKTTTTATWTAGTDFTLINGASGEGIEYYVTPGALGSYTPTINTTSAGASAAFQAVAFKGL